MKKKRRVPPRAGSRRKSTKKEASRNGSSRYVTGVIDLDDEYEFEKDDDEYDEDMEPEDEPEEEEDPIEDLAESLDADTYDRAGSDESLDDRADDPEEDDPEEEIMTDDEVLAFTQEFVHIPDDIADLEAGDPPPAEYDAYSDDEDDSQWDEVNRAEDTREIRPENDGDDHYDEGDGSWYSEDDGYDEASDSGYDDDGYYDSDDPYDEGYDEAPEGYEDGSGDDRGYDDYPGDDYDGYEDDDEPVRKAAGRRGRKHSKLSVFEVAAIGMSVVLAVAAILLGVVLVQSRGRYSQLESFRSIGSDLSELRVIGESGLIAMRDASQLSFSEEDIQPEEEAVQEEQLPVEEVTDAVDVTFNLTTIKGDLKIKFVNKATEKLVANAPFSVSVKAPGGKTETWKDDDMDGIIYKTGLGAGEWSVTIDPFDEEHADLYNTDNTSQTVTIKDTIEYKKVDVSDEIKDESQINVAAEDTQPKDAPAVESENVDTVEWVESTKEETPAANTEQKSGEGSSADNSSASEGTSAESSSSQGSSAETGSDNASSGSGSSSSSSNGFNEIKKDDIVMPGSSAALGRSGRRGVGRALSGETVEKHIHVDSTAITLDDNGTGKINVSVEGLIDPYVEFTSSDPDTISVNENGELRGYKPGKVTITLVSSEDPDVRTTVEVTVGNGFASREAATAASTKASSGGSTATGSVSTGEKLESPEGSSTGSSAGKENSGSTASSGSSASDKVLLKTSAGEQVYVKDENGNFREATIEDYETATAFYVKEDIEAAQASTSHTNEEGEIIYHGWQTIDGHTYYFDKDGNYVTGEQVIQGVKYTFGKDGILAAGSGVLGIDVSKWNGSIDWESVKNSGVNYAIIRCGFRGTSTGVLVEDSAFRKNMQGAAAAGLKLGVYFYSAAVSDIEAVEEASMAASLCSGYNLAYPVFLDVERSDSGNGRADNISVADRTEVVKAFCATMENSGFKAGLYSNRNWMEEMIDTPSLTNYKLWVAQYTGDLSYKRTRADMWQYTRRGSIKGISGKVDLNLSYID